MVPRISSGDKTMAKGEVVSGEIVEIRYKWKEYSWTGNEVFFWPLKKLWEYLKFFWNGHEINSENSIRQ